MKDPFTQLSSIAHSGAFGLGSPEKPTPAQIRAGNYAKGSMRLQGMPITIETPMHQPRRGKQDGLAWSVTCMGNYGYLNGVVGADGDNLDVYVGPVPESQLVVVVNQVGKEGAFDEHKVMLGYYSLDSALNAYMNSYEKGWRGLGSYVACSLKQFKAWIKAGDLTKPLVPEALQADPDFQLGEVPVQWGSDNLPSGQSLGDVLYALRAVDTENLLLDSATMSDLEEFLDDGTLLDALVIEYSQFQRKADQLLKVMSAAASGVKPASVEVSKPFKKNGTTQVAMLFVMDDGQTVAVFFHNPDSTPNKLTPSDELISWKWVLNKRDITITVAPERGQDLNPREVARRIMALVEKNSAKFTKAAAASAEKDAEITGLKGEVQAKSATLQALDQEITELTAQLHDIEAQKVAGEENQDFGNGADDAEAQKIARLLEMLASARKRLAAMAPDDAYYGNLTRDAADMARQLWDAGYRGPEAAAPQEPPQPDMLGDDPALKDKRTDLEKLTTALKAGNAMGALGVLDTIHDPEKLREVVTEAGFSPSGDSKDEILASVGKDLVRAAKAKVDGHGLQVPEQAIKPAPTPSAGSTILEDYADVAALGSATVISVGSENVYFEKAGQQYMTKLLNTDDYESKVGQVVDLSGVVDPSAAPVKRPYHEWEGDVLDALAALLEIGRGDADGIAMAQEALMQQLYADGKTPEEAAAAVQVASAVEPKTPEEEAMLAAHLAERAQAAAEAALSNGEEDTGEIEPEGRENVVKTAKGTKVVTGFKVIDASKLIISHESDGTPNPDYPAELQPRDRARATSQAWVSKTARSLDPDSLGRTNRADSGAPIVGPDRVVESGNGRAMSIREAYRIGQADEYRAWLLEHADYFKVSASKIESLKAPVLVRVRTSEVNRAEFAVEANQDDKLAMTATEKARSDAKRLDAAMLAKLADGDLTSAGNRDFINAFLQSLGDAEAAQYLTSDGRPTSSLVNRIQAALFAGAYADDRLLELTADVSKPEIANIVSALNAAAPDFMRAKDLDQIAGEDAGARVTDSVELSLNQTAVDSIINATDVLRKAKESGMGIEEFLRQGDMFGGVDPAVAAMAVFISQNNRSAKRLSTAFKAMAQFVETEVKRKQTAGLFGDEPATFTDIVKAANSRLEQEYGEGVFAIAQDDLFGQPPAQSAPEPKPSPEPDQDDALKAAKAYLDSVIEGTADFSNPDAVMKQLEQIYGQFGEGALSDLFGQAAEAFSSYALKMTAEVF